LSLLAFLIISERISYTDSHRNFSKF